MRVRLLALFLGSIFGMGCMHNSDWAPTNLRIDDLQLYGAAGGVEALSRDLALFAGWIPGDPTQNIALAKAVVFRVSRERAVRVFRAPGYIASLDVRGQAGWALRGQVKPGPQGGSDYFLVRSSDGGETWKETRPLIAPSLSQILAVSDGEAWLLGIPNLYRTVDGGKSWQVVTAPGTRNSAAERLALVNGAVLILGDGGLLASRDGGKTWVRYTVPATDAHVDAVFRDLVVSHLKGRIHVDVLDGKKGVILPGASFESPGIPSIVWGDPPAHIKIVVGTSGTELGFGVMLYETTDNGKTWKGTKIPCTSEAISIAPDGTGFAIDPEQRILAPK